MTPDEEEAFQQQVAAAAAETQTDMALTQIVAQLPPPAAVLLQRLPAYHTPVPREGIVKLGLDLPEVPALLQRLLAVSLVEPSYARDLQCEEYQLSPLVAAWLGQQGVAAPGADLYRNAAAYQAYLFRYERRTLAQAIAAHDALLSAQQREAADRLALDYIVGPLNRQGLYRTLLDRWLPPICDAGDPQTRAEALGQTGRQLLDIGQYETALGYLERALKIQQEIGDRSGEGATLNNIAALHHARGDYETALGYLERALKISQEIGDAAGMCATLFNMGHFFMQNGQVQEAVSTWVTVYRLATQINLAQVLQALEQLAGQLGLADGLAGWEALSRRMADAQAGSPGV
jgi:tetratricopeptide (TPR) repeat protein